MILTAKEGVFIHHCLHFKGITQGELRELDPLAELPLAKAIYEKIPKKLSEDGKSTEFIDGEASFEVAEKQYLLSILERRWPLQDGIVYLGLREKLMEKSTT